MDRLTLVIGNRNYSSWSLRPWLLLKRAGLAFEEVMIGLRKPDTKAQILKHSPAGKVPVLKHGDLVIWDSLAIAEYVAELAPQAKLWPLDARARAVARSVSAEMHSGFAALRQHLPMDLGAKHPLPDVPEAAADIARVLALWSDCRNRFGAGGPFLFGQFSIADAMFAPVVTRFVTYGVTLPNDAKAYCDAIVALPEMREWTAAAVQEPRFD